MPRVMKHSWVTRSTQWPLRTVREMIRAGDTLGDDDAPEMPDFMSTLNVLDIPRQVCSGGGLVMLCTGPAAMPGCCRSAELTSALPWCMSWQADGQVPGWLWPLA